MITFISTFLFGISFTNIILLTQKIISINENITPDEMKDIFIERSNLGITIAGIINTNKIIIERKYTKQLHKEI